MQQIIAFVRDIPEEQADCIRKMSGEAVSACFADLFYEMKRQGFFGAEYIYIEDDGTPLSHGCRRINVENPLIDTDLSGWKKKDNQ